MKGLSRHFSRWMIFASILFITLSSPLASSQISVSFTPAQTIEVPAGSPIENAYLDGVIGREWNDALQLASMLGTHSATVYMKHDGKYWYVALNKKGWLGWNIDAYIEFDADRDRKHFEAGDDLLYLPLTNGRLATDIDYSYVSYMNPKKDTTVGGTNDKVGASKATSEGYVFEVKIDMNSGDQGGRGNDISLAPCETIEIIIGLYDDRRREHMSPEYSIHIRPGLCSCSVQVGNLWYCRGAQVQLRITNNGGSYCDFFSCSIHQGGPGGPSVRDLIILGLPPWGSVPVPWDQRDNSGALVPPGFYCISCGCSSVPVCFWIVDCSQPVPIRPPVPIPEPSPGERPPSPPGPGAPVCQDPPVFRDTFNNPSSGWPTSDSPRAMGYDLSLQEYFIAIQDAYANMWSINRQAGTFSDFCLTVRAKPAEGPDYGAYGVVFRYQDDNNFYLFTISGDGYYSLHKRVGGQFTALISHQAAASINKGKNTNILHVIARGQGIWLFVNGQQLANVNDSSFTQGKIGLLAAPGLHARFDDVEVRPVR